MQCKYSHKIENKDVTTIPHTVVGIPIIHQFPQGKKKFQNKRKITAVMLHRLVGSFQFVRIITLFVFIFCVKHTQRTASQFQSTCQETPVEKRERKKKLKKIENMIRDSNPSIMLETELMVISTHTTMGYPINPYPENKKVFFLSMIAIQTKKQTHCYQFKIFLHLDILLEREENFHAQENILTTFGSSKTRLLFLPCITITWV